MDLGLLGWYEGSLGPRWGAGGPLGMRADLARPRLPCLLSNRELGGGEASPAMGQDPLHRDPSSGQGRQSLWVAETREEPHLGLVSQGLCCLASDFRGTDHPQAAGTLPAP